MPMPMPMHGHGPMMHEPMAAHSHQMPTFMDAGHGAMHAATSDHSPAASSSHASSAESESKDLDTSASQSDTTNSNGRPADQSKQSDPSLVAPLFVPSFSVPPPWWAHGSPVFVSPSAEASNSNSQSPMSPVSPLPFGLSNFIDEKSFQNLANGAFPSFGREAYQDMAWSASSSEPKLAHPPTMPTMMPASPESLKNMASFDWNNLLIPSPFSLGFDNIANSSELNNVYFPMPSAGSPASSKYNRGKPKDGGRGLSYFQPIISSVQKLVKNSRPALALSSLEEGLARQGQRMKASYSHIVPVVVNYTSNIPTALSNSLPTLPSLPSLPTSLTRPNISMSALWQLIERNNDPTASKDNNAAQRSKYLESLRTRIRPVTLGVESIRMTPLLETIWKNVRRIRQPHRGRGRRRGAKKNFPDPNAANEVQYQQYLEQVLSSKWWEWPTTGVLGPNLNQY